MYHKEKACYNKVTNLIYLLNIDNFFLVVHNCVHRNLKGGPNVRDNQDGEAIPIINSETFQYSEDVLRFLFNKLDSFTLNCFNQVRKHHNHLGFSKTTIEDYHSLRKKYDASFLILEYQGFIEWEAVATSKRYFLTIRGRQLFTLIKAEREKLKKSQELKGENTNG